MFHADCIDFCSQLLGFRLIVEEQQYKLELVVDRDCFLELSRQMYEMRTVTTGGVLKRYLKQLEQEPEDLIGRNETKTEDEVNEGHLLFNWKSEDRKYKLLD